MVTKTPDQAAEATEKEKISVRSDAQAANTTENKTPNEQDKKWLAEMRVSWDTNSAPEQKPDFTRDVGAYAHSGYAPTQKDPWKTDKLEFRNKAWAETAKGRLAIRLVTRGVLGCAFFAWGNLKASGDMNNYDPTNSIKDIWSKNADDTADNRNFFNKAYTKALPVLAKIIDNTAGESIKWAVDKTGGDGQRAVTFRPTRSYRDGVWGRSLGHEVVGITFDFAMASVGDSLGRQVMAMIDPNTHKSWIKTKKVVDRETGAVSTFRTVDYPDLLKNCLKMVWSTFSKHQMEDWAVAIPYAYQVKAQRNIINSISPGFEFDSDRALNGGSFKVNDEGRITGNYQLEGMIDLGARFTGYNIGTLMFREGYDALGDGIKKWWKTGKLPEINLPKSMGEVFDGLNKAARYALRSAIKGAMYMVPATFFFWITRTPQSKDIGLAINPNHRLSWEEKALGHSSKYGPLWFHEKVDNPASPDHGKFMYFDPISKELKHADEAGRQAALDAGWKPVKNHIIANGMYRGEMDKRHNWLASDRSEMDAEYQNDVHLNDGTPANHNPFHRIKNNIGNDMSFEPYKQKNAWHDTITNPIGQFIFDANKVVSSGVQWAGDKYAGFRGFEPGSADAKKITKYLNNYSRAYTYGVASYTPYMYSKAEFAKLWDNGKMDMAIDGMLDGVSSFSMNKIKQGFQEVKSAFWHRPFSDPEREKMANDRMKQDDVSADNAIPLEPGVKDSTDAYLLEQRQKKFATEALRDRNRGSATPQSKPARAWVAKEASREDELQGSKTIH